MNQVIDKIIKVSLVIMVLLSLFLTWKIWTKPANRSLVEKNKDNSSEVIQTKKVTDVFVATKLFFHPKEDTFLYSNKETSVLDISSKVSAFDFKHGKEIDTKEVNTALYASNSFSLVYPEELPLSVYETINELELGIPSKMQEFKFNRIIFSLADEKAYFVNQQLTEGVEYDVAGDSDTINKLLKDETKNNYIPVGLTPENVANIYYIEDEIKLKTYSYILATPSVSTFTKAFFNQPNDLYANEGDNVNLANSEGESLTILADTGEVKYFGKLKQSNTSEDFSLYYDTFQYVENIGNTLGTLRFFDAKETDVIYRNYIEGFPVFGQDMKGRLEVGVQNKTVFVRTNQETIQIPIPSAETVTLQPTKELMDELINSGADTNLIEDVQIAYEWQTNSETKQAIDLVPTWYVKYEDTWHSAAELIAKLQEGEV